MSETTCWCSKTVLPLNAKHIVSCCKMVSSEINARHDGVVNILLNSILVQSVDPNEEMWEEMKTMKRRETRSPSGPSTHSPMSGTEKAVPPERG